MAEKAPAGILSPDDDEIVIQKVYHNMLSN
jgi:hypothetical protein